MRAAGFALFNDAAVQNFRMFAQRSFYFGRFYPESADFQLTVDTAKELQAAIGKPANFIP